MNLKEYYMSLLSGSAALTDILGQGKILSSYPNKVENFPLVIFDDMNSSDVEFSDNLPNGTSAQVRIHIFSKTVGGFPKTEAIAEIIRSLFRADYWTMTNNQDLSEADSIKHRVMDFRREFYSL